jgi:nucleoside 2-deoxyribosyltransferase
MKVYFSASSSNLIKDKELYLRITNTILKSGGTLISNWIDDKTKLNANDLFEQTTKDIKSADFLVAEITYPSTGVGQQIGLALSWKIPVVALKRIDINNDSRFTVGTKSPYLKIVKYNLDSLEKTLSVSFEDIKKSKYIKFNFVTTREINDYLEQKSNEKKISKSELLREIVEDWKNCNN